MSCFAYVQNKKLYFQNGVFQSKDVHAEVLPCCIHIIHQIPFFSLRLFGVFFSVVCPENTFLK